MYYFFDLTTGNVIWEVDCEQSESREASVQWTDKPLEEGANAARYGVTQPEKITIEGIVTAWPFGQRGDVQRITTKEQALIDLMYRKQPVSVVAGYRSSFVVIEGVKSQSQAGDAEQVPFSIQMKTVKIVRPEVTKMPPARIKPKPRKRAATGAKGGKQTTEPESGATAAGAKKKRRSLAAYLFDGSAGRLGQALGR